MPSTKQLAFAYSILSIFIGPGIISYALGRDRVGTDCSDTSWEAVSKTVKNAYYEDAAEIMIVASSIMLILGIVLLIRLLYTGSNRRNLGLICLLAFMLLGYACIFLLADSWNCM